MIRKLARRLRCSSGQFFVARVTPIVSGARTGSVNILSTMRRSPVLPFALALALAPAAPARAGGDRPAEAVRPRVEHHLREAEQLARHFEGILAAACPQFETAREWRHYFNGEVDRVVTLLAHLEQAWAEAKTTPDDDVRRAAKAPRRQRERVPPLIEKLQACANGNGSGFTLPGVWRRIERDVPQRQSEIALPPERSPE
jgi:hypothetical protein